MKTEKQSLVDWMVSENGKIIASITKVKHGYTVKLTGDDNEYFIKSFVGAKRFISVCGK